jgi:hypothetical protein
MTRGPLWTVEIAAHELADGRWSIPACSYTLGALDGAEARAVSLRWAHAAAGCPAMRPLLRQSWPYSSVRPARRGDTQRVAT